MNLDLSLLQAGDILLFGSAKPNFFEKAILWAERGQVFHAAVLINKSSPDETIVEAATSGVRESLLIDYKGFNIIARRLVSAKPMSPAPSNQDDNLALGN